MAVSIMLNNVSYEPACALLGLKPLHVRRLELCERFVVTSMNGRHKDLFKLLKDGSHYTRLDENKFREHICRKSRFFKSPLPYLTRLLNQL